jgi:uncharacterized protein YdeI (YjbR/CyaY-like superfamily)
MLNPISNYLLNETNFFRNQAAFRRWLEKNHKKETEIIVGFFKKDSGKPNMTWSQSVDEALCFGWIDGVRRSVDSISYCIRFTPRRSTSTWSTVNIKKVEELLKDGRMQPAGLEIFNQRKEEKSGVASYENDAKQLDEGLITKFKDNSSAWEFFTNQAPSYQKMIIHWIMAAKQEATKLNRLEKTIRASETQKRVL